MSEAHPRLVSDVLDISGRGDLIRATVERAPQRTMPRREKATIGYSFAASLALHSAIITALLWHSSPAPPTASPLVVIEVQGLVADKQIEQKALQETRGQEAEDTPKPTPTQAAPPDEPQIEGPHSDTAALPEPPPPKPTPPKTETSRPVVQQNAPGTAAQDISGNDAAQKAQTIATEKALIALYVQLLAKKIQTNLIYPEEARKARLEGKATVSFTILSNGDIQPDSLAISASSGEASLDEGALKTVRLSVPFDAPPKEITVSVGVTFGPEH